jgi:hypothetical protein
MKKPSDATNQSTINRADLIALTGWTEQWIYILVREGKLPESKNGSWPLFETWTRILEYERTKVDSEKAELARKKSEIAEEDKLLKRAKRMKIEGELLEKDSVEKVWSSHITSARQILTRFGLDKKQLTAVLRELEISPTEYLK